MKRLNAAAREEISGNKSDASSHFGLFAGSFHNVAQNYNLEHNTIDYIRRLRKQNLLEHFSIPACWTCSKGRRTQSKVITSLPEKNPQKLLFLLVDAGGGQEYR